MKYEIEFECPNCKHYNNCVDEIERFLYGYYIAQCKKCQKNYKLYIVIEPIYNRRDSRD